MQRKLGEGTDAGSVHKLAQRVEETLSTTLNREPKHLDIDAVLVAPLNRLGAPPNVRYVHDGILKRFKEGLLPQQASERYLQAVLERARQTCLVGAQLQVHQGNPQLPPIDASMSLYGSLACTHLNIASRCAKAGVHSPIGDLRNLLDEDTNLR